MGRIVAARGFLLKFAGIITVAKEGKTAKDPHIKGLHDFALFVAPRLIGRERHFGE